MTTPGWKQRLLMGLALVFVCASLFALVPSDAPVSAQGPTPSFWQVRAIKTRDFGVPNPGGFAFSPVANSFLLFPLAPVVPSTSITLLTLYKNPAGSVNVAAALRDPLNVALDSRGNRLVALDSTT